MPKRQAALQDPGQGLRTGRVPDGIIQDINRHAAVVMEGQPADQAQQHTAEDVAQAVRLAKQVLSGFPFWPTSGFACIPLQRCTLRDSHDSMLALLFA